MNPKAHTRGGEKIGFVLLKNRLPLRVFLYSYITKKCHPRDLFEFIFLKEKKVTLELPGGLKKNLS